MAIEEPAAVDERPAQRFGALAGAGVAANSLPVVFLLGVAGIIFAWGYDGLAFALGLGAGSSLLQLLVAPRLAIAKSPTLWGYLNERYRCRVLRFLAAGAIALATTMLLVALLMLAGLILARLTGLDFTIAVAAAAAATFACYVVLNPGVARVMGAGAFLLLGAVLLLIAVLLSAQYYGLPLPQFAYANALWQIQGIEEALLEQDLADPAVMKPLLAPFMTLNPLSFAGIVLGLATGVAVWPAVAPSLVRTTRLSAQRTALCALLIVVVLLTLLPALAAYGRLAFMTLMAEQISSSGVPPWLTAYGAMGMAEACGRPALDAAVVVAACADLPDAPTVLRVQDISLSPDVLTIALPEMAGLGQGVSIALALTGLAAAVLTALAPLAAGANAVLGAIRGWDVNGATPRLHAYAVGAVLVAIAAAGAALRPGTIVEVGALAMVLGAAALFPAVVGGLWWRRANAVGAVAALVVGLGLALAYLVGAHYFPVAFYEATSALSAAGEHGYEYFSELKEVWLAAEDAEQQAAWIALNQYARDIADWWGIAPLAVGLIALPAGFLALIVGSLLTSKRGGVTSP